MNRQENKNNYDKVNYQAITIALTVELKLRP